MPSDTSLTAAPRPFDPAGECPPRVLLATCNAVVKRAVARSNGPIESIPVQVYETKMRISGQTAPRKLAYPSRRKFTHNPCKGVAELRRPPDVVDRLRKEFARLLLESFHGLDVWNRPVAHAGNTQFRELVIRWDTFHDHDVDRQRRFLSNPADMVGLGQPGNEEAGRAGRGVCLRSLQGFVDIAAVT